MKVSVLNYKYLQRSTIFLGDDKEDSNNHAVAATISLDGLDQEKLFQTCFEQITRAETRFNGMLVHYNEADMIDEALHCLDVLELIKQFKEFIKDNEIKLVYTEIL